MSKVVKWGSWIGTIALISLFLEGLSCGPRSRVVNPSEQEATAPATEAKPWVRRFGGITHEAVNSLAPALDGGVIIAGDFFHQLELDNIRLSSSGRPDIFVAHLLKSGTVAWATSFGGEGIDVATTVSTDGAGSILVGGEFEGTAMFGDSALTADDIPEYFLARLASDGSFLWSRSLGRVRRYLSLFATMDSQGNIFVNHFSTRPDDSALDNSENSDIRTHAYLAMVDLSGEEVWHKTLEEGSSGALLVSSMALDDRGESITIVGTFRGDVGIGGGIQASKSGSWDGIVARFDTKGALQWEQRFSSDGNDFGHSVSVKGGVTYTTGLFTSQIVLGQITLQAPPLDPALVNIGEMQANYEPASTFLMALDKNGQPLWATNELLESASSQVSPGSPSKEGFSISWTAAQPEVKGPILHSRLIPTCSAHQLGVVDARPVGVDGQNPEHLVLVSLKDLENERWRVVYFNSDGEQATGRELALPDWGTTYGIAAQGSNAFAAGSLEQDYSDLPAHGARDIFVAHL